MRIPGSPIMGATIMWPAHRLALLCGILLLCSLSACSRTTADTGSDTRTANANLDAASTVDTASLALTQLTGRHEDTAGYPRASWSGSAATIRVTGNELAVRLNGVAGVHFNVIVDGTPVSQFSTVGGEASYSLVQWTQGATHDVQIYRRDEGTYGAVGVLGFQSSGVLAQPAASPTRHLEFIGDSLTCGYGIEGSSAQCTDTAADENAYLTYASVAARSLSADANLICVSGKGVARNSDGSTTDTMPALYDRAVTTQATPTWDVAADNMDAVIINLGTNDYFGGVTQTEYVSAYRQLIERIRTTHPHSLIVAVTWAGWGEVMEGYVTEAVTQVQAEDLDNNLQQVRFVTDPADGYGCASHTNVVTNAKLGAQLSSSLKERLGW